MFALRSVIPAGESGLTRSADQWLQIRFGERARVPAEALLGVRAVVDHALTRLEAGEAASDGKLRAIPLGNE